MGILDRRQDIFVNPQKVLTKSDPQEVGIDLSQSEIAGRHDHVGEPHTVPELGLQHVAGSAPRLGSRHITRREFREKWRK